MAITNKFSCVLAHLDTDRANLVRNYLQHIANEIAGLTTEENPYMIVFEILTLEDLCILDDFTSEMYR